MIKEFHLLGRIASGAFHNSAERYDPPKCHPNTRKAVIQEIIKWTENDSLSYPFLWMYGPAGSGKSSIAQTIAEILEQGKKSVASFFFARTAPLRNNDSRLIATIAYQLTVNIPEMKKHVYNSLRRDPTVFDRSLSYQMDKLILEPLAKFAGTTPKQVGPNFIIIDGLDECGDSKSPQRILTVLFSAIRHSRTSLFFLIACRPEYEIRNFFNQDTVHCFSRRLVLDNVYKPDEDIAVLLRSTFLDIRNIHPAGSRLPVSWPSDHEIEQLVEKASGQFIYASTVIKFVESPDHWPPERLKSALGSTPNSLGRGMPFADLDALYSFILSSVANYTRAVEVFVFLLFKESDVPGTDTLVEIIEDFLGFRQGEVDMVLKDLHSIIHVPAAGKQGDTLSLFHASLRDFLLDRTRSGSFFIGSMDGHAQMARHCARYLAKVTCKFFFSESIAMESSSFFD